MAKIAYEKQVFRHIRKLERKLKKYKGGERTMNALQEALKEALRVVVLAIIPLVVLGLQNGQLDLKLIVVTGLIAGLRFIDSWLHQSGKAEGGLTRF